MLNQIQVINCKINSQNKEKVKLAIIFLEIANVKMPIYINSRKI